MSRGGEGMRTAKNNLLLSEFLEMGMEVGVGEGTRFDLVNDLPQTPSA